MQGKRILFWIVWIAMIAGSSRADKVTFQPIEPGKGLILKPKVLPGRPLSLLLSADPPGNVQTVPGDFGTPLFATLRLGPRENPQSFALAIEEVEGKTPRLLLDANQNGDLTDDPVVLVTPKEERDADGRKWILYHAQPLVPVRYETGTASVPVNMQWYDKASRMRIAGAPRLNYTLALFLGGEIRLGEHTYRAALCDTLGMGDFRGNAGSPASGILLVIDVNGNGAYDARGEAFDIAQPFTIQKVTYEVQGIAASGASFEIVKSSRSAPEIPPPPDLRPGKAIVPFVVKTMEGKTVRFPEDYKGKLVLLTFWASWCGDCKAELPNMVEAYTKYQQKGLAILGISLDQANHAPQLTAFLKANKMPWPQVYDGKFWSTPIAQLYGISWIPTSYLVDGDTGKILAEGDCLLGKNLIGTIQKDLAKKFPPT